MERSPTLTIAERRDQGRQARQRCPRQSHGTWKSKDRTHDPLELLRYSNADRIPGLVPVRHGRMLQSPFAFFRGSAIIQARDLAASPGSGIIVQACGDCHLMNFGGFATPERHLVFDINDFDETFPAPWEWDVKRLAASIAVAAHHLSFPDAAAESAVRAAVASYCRMMSEYAGYKALEMWYTQIRLEDLLEFFHADKVVVRGLKAAAARARSRTSEHVFPKLTAIADGHHTIVDDPPFIYHMQRRYQPTWSRERQEYVRQYVASIRPELRTVFWRYKYQDTAVKVVGVGSVGTRCLVGLYLAADDDPLFLQTKEARRSVLESPIGKSRFANQGKRVVTGQRLMQAASDIFLGWFRAPGGHDYYVRQLRDMKVATEIETFTPRVLRQYATMCGWALARAHAKAGDAASIAAYLGKGEQIEDALWSYAKDYADQVEREYDAFRKAVRVGKLKVDTDEAESLGFLP
jgi:uncharacterized protein (DUF2252 family)